MSVRIEDITLQIDYESHKASEGIDALANSLKNLKGQLTVKGLERLANGLGQVNASLSGLNGESISKVSRLASALEKLSIAKGNLGFTKGDARGIENIANANVSKTTPKDIYDVGYGMDSLSEPTKKDVNAIQELNYALAEARDKMGSTATSMQKLSDATEVAKESTKKLNKEVSQTKKSTKSATSSVNSHTSALGKLIKSLGRIAMYRILRSMIKEVTQGFKEGVQNIARYSAALNGLDSNNANGVMSELATLSLYVKNALGTIAIPILNSLLPALNALASGLVTVINLFNQFFAFIGGKGTYTRAKKNAVDYAKSLDKAGGSAKKLKDNLLGIDELNIIHPDDEGGGSGEMNPLDMFEEAELPDWWEKLKGILDGIKKAWEDFVKSFLEGWKDAWERLNMAERIKGLLDSLKHIGEMLVDIFTDPKVIEAFKRMQDSFAKMLGKLAVSGLSIGLSFAEMFVGGFEKFLEEHIQDIKDYLVESFNIEADIFDLFGEFGIAIAEIFRGFGEDAGKNFMASLMGVAWELFENISLTFKKMFRDISEMVMQPIIDNAQGLKDSVANTLEAITPLIDGIKNALDTIGQSFQTMYDEHIEPFLTKIQEFFSNVLGVFVEWYNSDLAPIFENLMETLGTLFEEYLAPLFESIMEFLGPLIDLLGVLFEEIIFPYLEQFISGVLVDLKAGLELLVGVIKIVIAIVETLISTFTLLWDLWKNILSFVRDIFTVGIEQAVLNMNNHIIESFANFKERFTEIWENVKSAFEDIVNAMIDLINGFLEKCQAVLDIFNQFTGLSLSVPEIGHISLGGSSGMSSSRGFASGGFPTTGQLFIARESGAELVGGWGNQTAVANNEQIVNGIKNGVAEAVSMTLAPYLNDIANNTYATAQKDFEINIDDRSIARASARGQKSMGRTLISTV